MARETMQSQDVKILMIDWILSKVDLSSDLAEISNKVYLSLADDIGKGRHRISNNLNFKEINNG